MQTTTNWSGTAKSVFGFEQLRPFQKRVLETLDAGRDCLAVSPTGSGKTACFALPAAREMFKDPATRNLILVVSPLIALMHDQARKLNKIGILPALFDRLQTTDSRSEQWDMILSGAAPVVFVSPERLALKSFRDQLTAHRKVCLAVIDEAHCTSQWGFSLRPEYRLIGEFLDQCCPDAPRLALTATASPGVRHDIIQSVGLRDPEVVLNEFERTNIQVAIRKAAQWKECHPLVVSTVLEQQRHEDNLTIIYAPTRRAAGELQASLVRSGIHTAIYHAGMDAMTRNKNQRQFIEGNTQCMVATSAFGLGIDMPDIRHVIHAGMPQNLEQYIQETGRAGRDGKPARATMIFHPRDFHTHRFMIEMQFPRVAVVKAVWQSINANRSMVTNECIPLHSSAIEKTAFVANLAANAQLSKGQAAKKEILSAVDFLVRENVLSEMTSTAPWDPTQDETILMVNQKIDHGPFHSEAFWRQYDFRRGEALTKLEHMRLFATTGMRSVAAAQEILRTYFEDSVDGLPSTH